MHDTYGGSSVLAFITLNPAGIVEQKIQSKNLGIQLSKLRFSQDTPRTMQENRWPEKVINKYHSRHLTIRCPYLKLKLKLFIRLHDAKNNKRSLCDSIISLHNIIEAISISVY